MSVNNAPTTSNPIMTIARVHRFSFFFSEAGGATVVQTVDSLDRSEPHSA
jgi:hypothetical protein